MSVFSFLDRDHTVAGPGFSRWMVPPAALCVHLCIGQAYALQRVQSADDQAARHYSIGARRLEADRARLDLLASPSSSSASPSAVFGRWVEEGGPRRAMFTAALCWAGGFFVSAHRHLRAQALADLSRLRRARRHRAGHRLHLAGVDADQVVSRPSGHGDRHGHHGLRRRRLHRLAAVGVADEQVHDPDPCRRRRDLHRARHRLLLLHDGRRGHRARAARPAGSRRAIRRRRRRRS